MADEVTANCNESEITGCLDRVGELPPFDADQLDVFCQLVGAIIIVKQSLLSD